MNSIKEKVIEANYFRHACKEFDSNKKISSEDFDFILETARLSPSSFGFEPWKFLVLQNSDMREKIKPVCWGAQKQLPTSSHFVIILARKNKDMIYSSEYIVNFMKEVQQLPEDIIKLKSQFYKNFQENDFKLTESNRAMFDWACKQTYIPLTNMMISAAQIGIDSCPIEGFDRKKVDQILSDEGVINKDEFSVSCMVSFGYREEEPRPKTRQSMDKIVEWI